MDGADEALLRRFHLDVAKASSPRQRLETAERWRENHLDRTAPVASAILSVAESSGFPLDETWKAYKDIAKRQSHRKQKSLATLASFWSPEIVAHYEWACLHHIALEELAKLATLYPQWIVFVGILNLALLDRQSRSIKSGRVKGVGEHDWKSPIQRPELPLLIEDLRFVKNALRDPENLSPTEADVKNWIDGNFDLIHIGGMQLSEVPAEQLVHRFLQRDLHGMLIPVNVKTARRFLGSVRKRDQALMSSAYEEPLKKQTASRKLQKAEPAPKRASNIAGESKSSEHRGCYEDGELFVEESTGSSSEYLVRGGECASDVQCEPSCCVGARFELSPTSSKAERKAYEQAKQLHDDMKRINKSSPCHPCLSWIAQLQMAQICHSPNAYSKADVTRLKSAELSAFLAKNPNGISKPYLIEEEFDKEPYTKQAFFRKLAACLGDKSLDVVNPYHVDGREHLSIDEFLGRCTSGAFGLNALSMPDYIGVRGPNFLTRDRFELLSTICWRAAPPGKSPDLKECLRFNIFANEGAFSGAHCDIVSGTWVRPMFGTRLWMWVCPDDMTEQDWSDFIAQAHAWVPPRGKIHALWLTPGLTFVMPAGKLIPHAVLTVEASAMVGGMFWDAECIASHLECFEIILRNPNISNEPPPFDFGCIIHALDLHIRDFQPQAYTDDFKARIQAILGQRCNCKKICRRDQCPCSRAYRRCTPLCGDSLHGRVPKCYKDQWWV